MKNQRALLAIYKSTTGKTTASAPDVPGDDAKNHAKRLGYWPDRSMHYGGW